MKAASEVNHVPYYVFLNYWRKRFSVTLQTFNARLITQAYLVLSDDGGGNARSDECCQISYLLIVIIYCV